MLLINNRLQDDILTSEELKERCVVKKTTKDDIFEIARILCNHMGVNDPMLTFHQLMTVNIVFEESVKIVDEKTNKIYGILILAKHPLNVGSPIQLIDYVGSKAVEKYKQINGFVFIIDERLRGCGFDREMIKMVKPYIDTFDFIWVAVEKDLRTHNYWKRLGMREILTTNEANFYCYFINKTILLDIYSYIMNNYGNYNKREF